MELIDLVRGADVSGEVDGTAEVKTEAHQGWSTGW